MTRLDFTGKYRTTDGTLADVLGWDEKAGAWKGDLEGFGPTQWDENGRHPLNPKFDLADRVREGKYYR